MITVTRKYQLGSESTFAVADGAALGRRIDRETRERAEGGDLQGVGYHVASAAEARALGAVETAWGAWEIPTGHAIWVDEETPHVWRPQHEDEDEEEVRS